MLKAKEAESTADPQQLLYCQKFKKTAFPTFNLAKARY
jgi:hypothetical protein